MDRNRITVRRGKIHRVLGCVSVHLEKIAAGQQLALGVIRHHFGDVDSVGVRSHPVSQLIRSPVFTIQQQIHVSAEGGKGHSHTTAYLKSHVVADERLVAKVVYQRPFLCLGGRLVIGAPFENAVAVAVVYLKTVRLVFMRSREIASHPHQYGPFLHKRTVFIKQGYAGIEILFFVLRHLVVLDMDAYRGQTRNLIETTIVPGSFISVKSQFGNGAMLAGRTHKSYIPHAATHLYVEISHETASGLFLNHIQGNGVHERGVISSLQNAHHHGSGRVLAWQDTNLRDDMGRAQIQTNPTHALTRCRIIRVFIAVKSTFRTVVL